jgi:hypothetical protein
MSLAGDLEAPEHVGDEYVTYNRRSERRPRQYFPPFPPNSEEEEETHMESERRAEREAECEVERMLGGRCDKPEGSGKAPHGTRGNLHVSTQQSGSQSAGHHLVFNTYG